MAALADRVGHFNVSMDPWERTGAAPQGWAPHLQQTPIPVQGYIQLRSHDTTRPSFAGCPTATAGTENEPTHTDCSKHGGGGTASPSVSIFPRAPLCQNTCRHCRSKPLQIKFMIYTGGYRIFPPILILYFRENKKNQSGAK